MSLDALITEFDRGLRALTGVANAARPTPGSEHAADDVALTPEEKRHAAALMRINHVGEVCAQALYQAQGMATRSQKLRDTFAEAAREEEDHLAWTAERIAALGGRLSLLNPLWYGGSVALGLVAGRFGDRFNLGFMAETERQVEHHLDSHLELLPAGDGVSRAIVNQMREDEIKHARTATEAGGADLPLPVRGLMRLMSKVMTRTAYYL